MAGGEHSLSKSAFKLLLFGIERVWKILNKRITNSVDELNTYKIVYRTAPATPGLLILLKSDNTIEYFLKLDGVGPVDNRPSTDKLHHFIPKNKNNKCDT